MRPKAKGDFLMIIDSNFLPKKEFLKRFVVPQPRHCLTGPPHEMVHATQGRQRTGRFGTIPACIYSELNPFAPMWSKEQ